MRIDKKKIGGIVAKMSPANFTIASTCGIIDIRPGYLGFVGVRNVCRIPASSVTIQCFVQAGQGVERY